MSTTQYCTYCNATVSENNQFCQNCGARIIQKAPLDPAVAEKRRQKKSGKTALILCILFGFLGIHRFYVGKKGTGILALLTAGGLGIWTLIDLILIIQNKFKDKKGRYVPYDNSLSILNRILLTLGVIGTWLLITISLLIAFTAYLTQGLVNIANNQLTALRTCKIAEAYSYNSRKYKQLISLDAFTIWVDQYPELKSNQKVTFTERRITFDEGFLAGTLTSTDGKEIKVSYFFVKEHGKWSILSITPIVEQTGQSR